MGYVDASNLYQFEYARPSEHTDPTGLSASDAIRITWEDDPVHEQFDPMWDAQKAAYTHAKATGGLGAYVLLFNRAATGALRSCHIAQNTEGHTNAGLLGANDWTTVPDIWSGMPEDLARKVHYTGHSFEDGPQFQALTAVPAIGQTIRITYWWQAHVYVEEAPFIETWYGFTYTMTLTANADPTAVGGISYVTKAARARWRGKRMDPFELYNVGKLYPWREL